MDYEDEERHEFYTAQKLNHSKNDNEIAISLVEFEQAVANRRLERLPLQELKKTAA